MANHLKMLKNLKSRPETNKVYKLGFDCALEGVDIYSYVKLKKM